MAIKDQCENCKKRATPQCTETIVYDGTPCYSYQKSGINLEKKEPSSRPKEEVNSSSQVADNSAEEFEYTREYLKANTDIHGWLTFFLVAIVIGSIASICINMSSLDISDYGDSTILALADYLPLFMYCGIAFYTVYAFIQRKPNAVFLGKLYLIAVFLSNLLALIIGHLGYVGFVSPMHLFRSLIWAVIWFSYLSVSKQVNEIIPKEYRKLSNSDYYIIAALILIPLALYSLGVKNALNSQEKKETSAFYSATELKAGEETDGRVIFMVPAGFSLDTAKVENVLFFEMTNDSVGTIQLCSDYEANQSASNIETYWRSWENEEASHLEKQLIVDEKREVNGFPYYYKVTRYVYEDSYVYWRFVMIFDKASSKVCLMSCYDGGLDGYIDELLNTVHFY